MIPLAASRPGDCTRSPISHHAATASSPVPATTAGTRRRRAGRLPALVAADGTVAPAGSAEGVASASRNCWIEGKRSTGTLAIARRIAASTGGGTAWRTTRTPGTGSSEWRAITAWADGPVKGGWPTSISYRVHARLY